MLTKSTLASLMAATCCYPAATAATTTNTTTHPLPSLDIPACPSRVRLSYNQTSPDRAAFPDTAVEACYEDEDDDGGGGGGTLCLDFLAYDETSFFYNATYATNGDIYNYEVMEVFMARGTSDPRTYLEFEVAPNNVTFQVRKRHTLPPYYRTYSS